MRYVARQPVARACENWSAHTSGRLFSWDDVETSVRWALQST